MESPGHGKIIVIAAVALAVKVALAVQVALVVEVVLAVKVALERINTLHMKHPVLRETYPERRKIFLRLKGIICPIDMKRLTRI
jgi:hypothetical protein